MNKRVLFRVDGGRKIGLGHLVRSIALADIIINNFDVYFFSLEIPFALKEELVKRNIKLIEIANEDDFYEKINENDIVVLDGYHFDLNYKQNLKSKQCNLVSILDFVEVDNISDVIINHNPALNINNYPYKKENQTLALGADYSLLRKSFLEQSKIEKKIPINDTVFACFGGSDSLNLTLKTLKVLIEYFNFKKINLVVGSEYCVTNELVKLLEKDARIKLLKNISEQELVKVFLESKIAIVSASTILLEAIACGTIPIICYYADNQKCFHDYVVKEFYIQSFSEKGEIKFNVLQQILKNKLYKKTNIIPLREKISDSDKNLLNLFLNL
ncbi:MAG TPA: UDP-2,4-diacetamido-2,4,6-trideoxy-beta-L-altropyranose hydrolase [Bacteroidales bacterium]|nr:UDP-2,4-diacetamido-2,4,6-trideoxy-beta-L-altropyranose hydrolase [Bacteroidales bacterium]